MAEYISKKDAINALLNKGQKSRRYKLGETWKLNLMEIQETIAAIPAADVQPVKRGYWIKQPEKFQIHEDVINSNYLYSCSCCNASDLHSERANNDGEVKFCWRCGAKMDAEPDEPWQSK